MNEDVVAKSKLKEIANFLREHPETWTKNALAKNRRGMPCFEDSDEAVCFCARGHVILRTPSYDKDILLVRTQMEIRLDIIARKKYGYSYIAVNDQPKTELEDIISLFDAAAGVG